MPTLPFTDRNAEIYRRRLAGESLAEIAQDYGITPERVRQIVWREETGLPATHKRYIPAKKAPVPRLESLPPYQHPFKRESA